MVEDAILQQKIGYNASFKRQLELARSLTDPIPLLIKKGRIDAKSCPMWKRVEVYDRRQNHNTDIHSDTATDTSAEQCWTGRSETDYKCNYVNRYLSCPCCGHNLETAHMHLFTSQGFPDTHCPVCKYHGGTKDMACQCSIAWHRRDTHRHDPPIHRSKRAPGGRPKNNASGSGQDSDRIALSGIRKLRKRKICSQPDTVKRKRTFKHGDIHADRTGYRIYDQFYQNFKNRIAAKPTEEKMTNPPLLLTTWLARIWSVTKPVIISLTATI